MYQFLPGKWSAVFAACAACVSLPASAANEALKVIDYAETFQGQGAQYVRSTIKTDLALRIIKEGLAILIVAKFDDQNNSCFAYAGITHPTDQWHTPRIPTFTTTKLYFANPSKPDYKADCLERGIKDAVTVLNGVDVQKLIQEALPTRPMGGVRGGLPDRRTISMISYGLQSGDLPVQVLNDAKFELAFDYRAVSVIVDASSWVDGSMVSCAALVGVTSTPPGGRNPFMPAHWFMSTLKSDQVSQAQCKKAAAKIAAQKMLTQPFTEQGILRDFERTREIGVTTPSSGSVTAAMQRGRGGAGSSGASSSRASSAVKDGCSCTGPSCIGPRKLVQEGVEKDSRCSPQGEGAGPGK